MERTIIITGKTIDLAIAAAVEQLRMDRDSFSVEVLENAKSGFLGIGASPAKIKVTYEGPDTAASPALSSASRSKPKVKQEDAKQESVKPMPVQVKPASAPVRPAPAPVRPAPAPARPQAPQQTAPAAPKAAPRPEFRRPDAPRPDPRRAARPDRGPRPIPVPTQPKVVKTYAPAPEGSTEEQIEQFVKGLLERMGSDAVPHAKQNEDGSYFVELAGDNLGMLIGRRGDTLDAIQHLTNYVVNRDADKRSRITVDAENYRGKREESLEHLARKMAAKAVKYRKNFTLEPMNAYERHVIHAALQDTPDVTTFSTGTEPNRRIVVAYSKNKPQE